MENKCIKKSTLFQLQSLVDYMEENSEFARGSPVYGGSKLSTEEQWQKLALKLNSMGPPMRSVVEWKKTWADLKSRTKKKIAENKKSLLQTGGGLYRSHTLSAMEQSIDRTMFLSKSVAPGGNAFGLQKKATKTSKSIDCFFESLINSPPRVDKAVAVITPTRQLQNVQHPHAAEMSSQQYQQNDEHTHTTQQPSSSKMTQSTRPEQQHGQQPHTTQQANSNHITQSTTRPEQQHGQQSHTTQQANSNHITQSTTRPEQQHGQQSHTTEQQQSSRLQQKRKGTIEDEMPGCTSAKKRAQEQLCLIRRQIRVSEESLCIAKDQANATQMLAEAAKRMTDAAQIQAEAAKTTADATVAQKEAAKISADAAVAQTAILSNLASLFMEFSKNK